MERSNEEGRTYAGTGREKLKERQGVREPLAASSCCDLSALTGLSGANMHLPRPRGQFPWKRYFSPVIRTPCVHPTCTVLPAVSMWFKWTWCKSGELLMSSMWTCGHHRDILIAFGPSRQTLKKRGRSSTGSEVTSPIVSCRHATVTFLRLCIRPYNGQKCRGWDNKGRRSHLQSSLLWVYFEGNASVSWRPVDLKRLLNRRWRGAPAGRRWNCSTLSEFSCLLLAHISSQALVEAVITTFTEGEVLQQQFEAVQFTASILGSKT